MSSSARRPWFLGLWVAVLAPNGCGIPGSRPPAPSEITMERDIHSYARPDECRVTHIALDLDADFVGKALRGKARLTLDRAPGASSVWLDTEGLQIAAVRDGDGAALVHALSPRDAVLGSALRIDLGASNTVVIEYETKDAAALQWLEPRQTQSGKPFLFTQGQAILTRTWIPCQDTPGVRQSYDARITAPAGLRAVMSAARLDDGVATADGRIAYRFALEQPVPSYLIALAVGDLAFRPIGARTGVFAEPQVVEGAAWELADTETMVELAERLYGPYRWGRFDVLILPPSFPFGGMENPCLTFATPTILAGDRSLVALIAHELAHSWSGNLVTNSTWSDLWLNEGFTVYFERRIMEALYGVPYAEMLHVLGWQDLQSDLTAFANGPDTTLHIDVSGRNPDDAFSNVPYEKGELLLVTIERDVGRERFDTFLADYFARYAFQPMSAERFERHLRDTLFAADAGAIERLKLRQWIHSPGLPDNAIEPKSAEFARVDAERVRFESGAAVASLDVSGFTTHHWLHLLRKLPAGTSLARLAELDQRFALTATGNSEIRFEWLRIAIRERYEAAFPALEDFLVKQGRRKFLKPLYEDLVRTDWGKALARRIYDRARPGYHTVSANTIDGILAKAGA
ncbi:MAG: M1 family metallopeptidase [Planctomycetes bacterium]|nr:M1 family metallopeptidase [Planctomycetota bacterium]MCC7169658.1 M1 family metallopeptidase [Planctomycetota bacterium]